MLKKLRSQRTIGKKQDVTDNCEPDKTDRRGV